MKVNRVITSAVMAIILAVPFNAPLNASAKAGFQNKNGSITVKCGKAKKTFTAKKYGKNFSRALNTALDYARKKATDKKTASVSVSKGLYA